MTEHDLNARDAKVVEWLREAQAKEAELETALERHIGLTEKMSYKKRLRSHLTETRGHKRDVESRIKQLGGSIDNSSIASEVFDVAAKTMAVVKDGVDAVRAASSERAEIHLRNAQDELREESVEIALYDRIEALAQEIGDTDTAKLAASIRRDELRMVAFLRAEIARLVKDVVRAEIPLEFRRRPRRRRPAARQATRRTSTARPRRAKAA